jgi:hypothetical protein
VYTFVVLPIVDLWKKLCSQFRNIFPNFQKGISTKVREILETKSLCQDILNFYFGPSKRCMLQELCPILLLKMVLESPINQNVVANLEFLANVETFLGLMGIVPFFNVQFFSNNFF